MSDPSVPSFVPGLAPADILPGVRPAGASAAGFPRFPRFSIRSYALVLILAVAVPLGVLLLGALRQIARQDEFHAAITAREIALIAASGDDMLLADARSMLERLAQRPAIQRPDTASCDAVFAGFSARLAPLMSLMLVDPAGRLLCSSTAAPPGAATFRDRRWFEAVAQGRAFVVDAPHRGADGVGWTVMVAVPVRRADGSLAGVLATALDLARLGAPASRGAELPAGSMVDLIDDRGKLLARSGGPGEIGRQLPGDAVETVLAQPRGDTRAAQYDGSIRVLGYARLASVPWTAIVSMPAAAVLVDSSDAELLNLLAVAAVLAAMLAATALVGRRMLRPLGSVAAVADAVARGDLSKRAHVAGPREVAGIAAEINRMLDRRQRDEVALRESEARFRQLFETSSDAIVIVDRDGRIVFANPAIERVLGRQPDALAGQDLATLQPERFRAPYRRAMRRLLASGMQRLDWRAREFTGLHADGREIPLEVGFSYLRTGSADVFAAFLRDISERRHAEVALRESEMRFRRLSTLYSALSRANEAMARTRGTAALLQQVCDIAVVHGGFHVVSIGLADDRAQCLRTAAVAGEAHEYFDRLVLPLAADEGCQDAPSLIAFRENRPYISNDRGRDARAIPIRNPAARSAIRSTAALPLHREGRVGGYLTVHSTEVDYFDAEMVELLLLLAADLSFALDTMAADRRREQAESDLRRLNATLEQKVEERTRSLQAANRELEAFSYSMSHDLRAPLRAINGFTELIAENHLKSLDHEARGYLERIRAASQRMARLIDDLMNLCRIARMDLVRDRLDLSRLAAEVVAELQEGEPQRAVHVRIAPGLVNEADRGLTQIVLANLLGNAWKFTARRERPAITFGATQRAGRPCYFVRDNGAGFDMLHAGKLFAPFQRLHAEHEFTGTGIGLSLVQRIVQRHGGTVSAESSVGEGTTVYFTLEP